MRKIRLRTVVIAVALVAVLLGTFVGLRRRSRRLEALALRYGREANRLENIWVESPAAPPGGPDEFMDRVHWNDSVANAYRLAASRPWVPFDPDPGRIACDCGHHARPKPTPAR